MKENNLKMENKTIYDSEVSLLDSLRQTYPDEIRDLLVDDGLCWAAISNELPDTENNNWPECLWTNSERRVLFLLKEPNRNEREDYKDWDWSEGSGTFGNVLAYWLEGLMRTTKQYCPSYDNISSRKDIFKKYPLAIVNSKKVAGGSSANWNTIWKYAERDKSFLRTQIREIIKPNIIVCGGSNDNEIIFRKVLSIALECIFPDIKDGFKKINNWCYYNTEKDIVLIDSYHPSFPMNEREKIEGLINGFHDFILKSNYSH